MSSVDNRVVQMTFDNASFEKKIDQTIKSLDALKTSIDKTGQSTGLQDVNDAVKKFDISKMALDVSGTSKKFLALSTVALTALSQITKSAISAGASMVKSLSFDLIMGGFEEYETNMRSIQTILANTASDNTNLSQVNAALDELNNYADLTIYNFAEMARNIGTFTAAGVDLETSTQSIKGIANLAAISGSNSAQASTAMYQLSQAISSGTVKLMDWNSVVNAGMGGEVFQRALFETGKTLGTIADVPLEQTFEQWTDAGNTFRGSLQDGWITSDVLTTTLQGFTGEMEDAELAALGFSEAQIVNIQKMGVLGVEAATKVRTLTQLFDTAKEAVGSGWSLTFRTVIGDFEQATVLFTSISDTFTKVIDKSSDKRNTMLADWSQWGGRAFLIESLGKVFTELGRVITVVSSAFRDVFPAKTAQDLYLLTLDFKRFADAIGPKVSKNLANIKRIVTGVANGFKIFSTIVSEAVKFAIDFFKAFSGSSSKSALDKASDLALKVTTLKEALVDEGGISTFFDGLRDKIDPIKEKFEALRLKLAGIRDTAKEMFDKFVIFGQKVLDFFKLGTDAAGAMGGALNRRFSFLSDLLPEFNLSSLLETGGAIVKQITDFVGGIFKALTSSFADADYDSAFDVLNTGIFAAIAAAAVRFVSSDGIFGGITESIGELTGVLEAMQTDLKATALMKIGVAVALLAASMFVLSTIDSASLTKALAAMAVGFGQLVLVMVVLTKLSLGGGALKLSALATTMILLAGAILILALAVKVMASMSLEELGKGLGGVAVALGLMIGALRLMPKDAKIIKSAVAIGLLSGAMLILALAMKIMATMSWEEIAKGLVTVLLSLTAFVLALDNFPKEKEVLKSAAAIAVMAGSLLILSLAMKILATLSWEELAKGLGGIAALLTGLVIALRMMPKNMALQAAGLLALALAIGTMAAAVVTLSALSIGELIKGLAGVAAVLLILAGAMQIMQGSIGGAIALGIASAAIYILARAVAKMASIGLFDMIKAFVGLAAAIVILAVAANLLSPVLPAMILLGIAMTAIGIGVAAMGIGFKAIASGLQTFVRLFGTAGETIGLIIQVIFGLFDDFVAAMVESFKVLLVKGRELLPEFFAFLSEFMAGLGQLIIEYIPILGAILTTFIEEVIAIALKLVPQLVDAAFTLITSFMETMTERLPEIVTLGADLVIGVINGLAEKVPEFVTAVVGLIVAFIDGLADNIELIIEAGANLIISFIEGIGKNSLKIIDAGFNTLVEFLEGLADSIRKNKKRLTDAGKEILDAIFGGIIEGAEPVIEFFTSLPGKILGWLAGFGTLLYNKGKALLTGIKNGIDFGITAVKTFFTGLVGKVLGWVGPTATTLFDKGWNFLVGLYNGVIGFVNDKLMPWFSGLPGKVAGWVKNASTALVTVGKNLVIGLWNGIHSKFYGWMRGKLGYLWNLIPGWIKSALGIKSPSRVMMAIGENIGDGLGIGIYSTQRDLYRAASSMSTAVTEGFDVDPKELTNPIRDAVRDAVSMMDDMDDLNPTITPVLDLSKVQKDASGLNGLLGNQKVTAKAIALTQNQPATNTESVEASSGNVMFEQNIYSPKELSAAEIYRQTRNQITIAKEELDVR